MKPSERTCPHCDGSGKGPQSGYWGAALTTVGHLPAECQNCGGTGRITVPERVREVVENQLPEAASE